MNCNEIFSRATDNESEVQWSAFVDGNSHPISTSLSTKSKSWCNPDDWLPNPYYLSSGY